MSRLRNIIMDVENRFGIRARGDRLAAQRRRDFLQSLTIVALCLVAIFTLSDVVAAAIALLGSIILSHIGKKHSLTNSELLKVAGKTAGYLPDGGATSDADLAAAQKFADALLESVHEGRLVYLLTVLDLLLIGWSLKVFFTADLTAVF